MPIAILVVVVCLIGKRARVRPEWAPITRATVCERAAPTAQHHPRLPPLQVPELDAVRRLDGGAGIRQRWLPRWLPVCVLCGGILGSTGRMRQALPAPPGPLRGSGAVLLDRLVSMHRLRRAAGRVVTPAGPVEVPFSVRPATAAQARGPGGGLMQVKVMVFDDGDGDGDGDRSVNYDRRCRNEDTTTSGKVIKNRL